MRRTSPILMLMALLLGVAAPVCAHAAGKTKHTAAHSQSKAIRGVSRSSARAAKAATAPAHAALPVSVHRRHGGVASGSRTLSESPTRSTRGSRAAGRRASARLARSSRLRTVALGSTAAGSHDSLVRQNVKVEEDGLERIENDEQLREHIVSKALVPVPTSGELAVNPSLPEDRRYCRPWTANFLADLAKAHAEVFRGGSLLVSSAVRTVEFQKKLRHHNRNAAPAVGDITSPHLTGATIDIAKSPLTAGEREWMRNYLLPLQNEGKIDVEEEFREACFHITVYKSYAPDTDNIIPADPGPPIGEMTAQGS